MKKLKITLIIILFVRLVTVTAQNKTNACNCGATFNETVSKLETNYLVYKKMELENELTKYNNIKKQFATLTKHTEPTQCTEIINKFLDFFKDGHLFVFELPKHDSLAIATCKKEIKSNIVNLDSINKLLSIEKSLNPFTKADAIIGTYTDASSEIAIIKENKQYKAYILSSTKKGIIPGELKATFEYNGKKYLGTYYTYDYQPRHVYGVLFKEGTLLSINSMTWAKTTSITAKREITIVHPKNPNLPTVHQLDAKNVLFSIPSFMADYQDFVQIVKENLEMLAGAENLIIDIRGNTGGNAIYFSFIELYATKTVMPADKQGEVLASKDTKDYYERMAKNGSVIYSDIAKRIENNIGKIIPGPKYPEQKLEIHPSKIKHVAIITDGAVGSAAESFILHSKKVSDKITTFGSPTYGIIDYTSVNSIKLKNSHNQNIYFGYPTSSIGKIEDPKYPNGYNERGILPDIPINKNVKDKIQFVMDYFKSKKS